MPNGKQMTVRFLTACENGTCVEVAFLANLVLMRDSKDPDGPVLAFTRTEFAEFKAGLLRGDFDDARTPDQSGACSSSIR
jgi:hypothetical protein